MAIPLKSIRLKDVQATCFTYDPVSGNVILPGRRAFMFVPIHEPEPTAPTRYTFKQIAVADATRIYCNPEVPSLFAIARGQSLELYEFNRSANQQSTEICTKKMEIPAHTKAIDDFAWCPTKSNWLVTCSRDQYAILWDVSQSEAVANFRATCLSRYYFLTSTTNSTGQLNNDKPPSPLGSSQVSGHVVVTTADSRLLFWDVRAGSRPAIVVQAHALRIHALDAGSASNEQYQLVTAADGDSRMALWDVRNLDRKITSIESPFGNQAPRRMRFSPAGGMLLVTASTMPRPASIDEPRAAVISLSECTGFMLSGHMDPVYDAIWPSGDTVLTWSQDFYLREFQVTTRQTLSTAASNESNLAGVSSSASDIAAALSRDSTPSTPPMLRPGTGMTVNAPSDSHTGQNDFYGTTPSASIPSSVPALLPLVSPQPTMTPSIPQPPPLPAQMASSTNLAGGGTPAIQFAIAPTDYMIPAPRTAGARFCPAGFLVSLHRLYELKQRPNDRALADFHKSFTAHSAAGGRPRSHRNRHTSISRQSDGPGISGGIPMYQSSGIGGTLTAGVLSGAVSPSSGGISVGHHHHSQSSMMPNSNSGLSMSTLPNSSGSISDREHQRQHTVLVYSVNALLKCNRELAIECQLDWTQPAESCRHNANVAMGFDRPDLAQAFSVAALVLDDSTFLTKPDLVVCIGRDALIRMFTHYLKQGCIQDAAMLAFFLSFTGIDLNTTPDDFTLNYLNTHDYGGSGRTPPLGEPSSGSLVPYSGPDGQHVPRQSPDGGMVIVGNSGQVKLKMVSVSLDYVEVSTVKRSSSWHDVQNVSPDGTADGSASASGETRSRHPSRKDSPQKAFNNRLVQMGAAKRRGQDSGTCCTPYAGFSESERIQMSVVLRCYATQLHAWRLHDRRTALLRPLNAISAGQLSPVEPTASTVMPMDQTPSSYRSSTAVPPTMTRSSTAVQGVTLYHQSSIDVTTSSYSNYTATNMTPTLPVTGPPQPPTANTCSVCDRPVRGLSSICVLCGHGGHALHIREFFSSNSSKLSCPAGCGCRCPSLRFPFIEV